MTHCNSKMKAMPPGDSNRQESISRFDNSKMGAALAEILLRLYCFTDLLLYSKVAEFELKEHDGSPCNLSFAFLFIEYLQLLAQFSV